MRSSTGCDLVMVGRACLGNPWIFRDIAAYLATGCPADPVTEVERLDAARRYLLAMVIHYGEIPGVDRSKKQLGWYTRGLPFSGNFRDRVFKMHRYDYMENALTAYRALILERENHNHKVVA
jgi:tRNA-dihydrouridine synthase